MKKKYVKCSIFFTLQMLVRTQIMVFFGTSKTDPVIHKRIDHTGTFYSQFNER